MSILMLPRFIKTMQKNIQTINYVLANISQDKATSTYDGDWNVVAVLCHLRDFDEVFFNRAQQMLNADMPTIKPVDHAALAIENDYNNQNLQDVLATFTQHRATFTEWLAGLSEEQWYRGGVHPETGEYTILQQAIQVCTHDADHLEQMMRMLAESE